MYHSKKSIICLFIALILFFYGIQFAAMEADSLPQIALAESAVSYAQADTVSISEAGIPAREILNTRSLSFGQSVISQFTIARKVIRLSWSFLVVLNFTCFVSKLFVAIIAMESPKPHKNMAVLHYIHNTDGKKRI